MRFILRYLALGLEVWFGVSGILAGTYLLISKVAIGTDALRPEFRYVVGFVLIGVGVALVVDAMRRELRAQLVRQVERFGNPLDSPTQAG